MKDINDYVVTKWAPQWKQLSRQLSVDQNMMSILEHNHGNDCVECCTRILEAWLEQSIFNNATWEALICAIDNLPIDLTGVCVCR